MFANIYRVYFILPLATMLLTACSHAANFEIIGRSEVPSIDRSKLLGELDPADYVTSLESKNSASPDGFYVYYLKSDDGVSKIVRDKSMYSLFYELVECDAPDIEIYRSNLYQLLPSKINFKIEPSYEYFAAYIPKNYPDSIRSFNKVMRREYKPEYGNLLGKCMRINASAYFGSALQSNLLRIGSEK